MSSSGARRSCQIERVKGSGCQCFTHVSRNMTVSQLVFVDSRLHDEGDNATTESVDDCSSLVLQSHETCNLKLPFCKKQAFRFRRQGQL